MMVSEIEFITGLSFAAKPSYTLHIAGFVNLRTFSIKGQVHVPFAVYALNDHSWIGRNTATLTHGTAKIPIHLKRLK